MEVTIDSSTTPRPLTSTFMIEATCHCGAVRLRVPQRPRTLTDCNCSICRRYGALWAYYPSQQVSVPAGQGNLVGYSWGPKRLTFLRCIDCGCVMNHQPHSGEPGTIGINARNYSPDDIATARIRRLDGAETWLYT